MVWGDLGVPRGFCANCHFHFENRCAHFRSVMNRRQQSPKGPNLESCLKLSGFVQENFNSRLKASEVWTRGWRTGGVGATRSSIAMPQVQTSFPHSFSYVPLGEGGLTSGHLFLFNAVFWALLGANPPPANPFSKPLSLSLSFKLDLRHSPPNKERVFVGGPEWNVHFRFKMFNPRGR